MKNLTAKFLGLSAALLTSIPTSAMVPPSTFVQEPGYEVQVASSPATEQRSPVVDRLEEDEARLRQLLRQLELDEKELGQHLGRQDSPPPVCPSKEH